MERIYRLARVAIFILGFVGAVAGADKGALSLAKNDYGLTNMINDMSVAEEANAINSGRWNESDGSLDSKALDSVARLFNEDTHQVIVSD